MKRFFQILKAITLLPACIVFANPIQYTDKVLDTLSDTLFFESSNGYVALQLGTQVDWVVFTSDEPGNPPGFFFPGQDKKTGYSPRLEITGDLFIGDYVTAFAKARWDTGIHPGSADSYKGDTEVRLDEFYFKARLFDTGASIRVGQFTPQIGGFLARHSTWQNSLISYPLLYENVTSITDDRYPRSDRGFSNRTNIEDLKDIWVPIIWAPLYNRGISIDGSVGDYTYSLNFLNSNLSSRGQAWNDNTWSDPTLAARLGYIPSPNWDFGLSFATGSYLREPLRSGPPLPPGTNRSDFKQTTAGIDLAYSARKWQLWAEAWYSKFEMPGFDESPTIYSYFIEGRYDLSSRNWLSLRWNHEFYNTLTDRVSGLRYEWDNEIFRIDLGYGIRWSRHLQSKFQYSYQHQQADFQNAEHFGALECSLKL